MNRPLALLALACCAAIALPAHADDDQVTVDRGRIEGVLGHTLQELARVEGLAEGCHGRQCAKIARALRRVEGQLRSLHDEVAAAPEHHHHAPAPPPAPVLHPVGPQKLGDLLHQMAGEHFSSGKLRVLGDAAGWAYFTSDQVVRILGHLTFGQDKLKALRILAPRILDPQNGYHIYKAFTFDSDKRAARKILHAAEH